MKSTWRQCPQCGAVEILTGHPQLDPETVFVTFVSVHAFPPHLEWTVLECPNCGHILDMQ